MLTKLSLQTLRRYEEHLYEATLERSMYQKACERTRKLYREAKDAGSSPSEAHYSFDFAQQVHLPSDPLQPGPVYFLTPRKVAIFGVSCEAVPRQV